MLTYGAGRMPGVGTGLSLIPTKTLKALLESLFRDPLFYSNKPETFSTSQPPGEGARGDREFSCRLRSDFHQDPATECKLGSLSSPMNVASSV